MVILLSKDEAVEYCEVMEKNEWNKGRPTVFMKIYLQACRELCRKVKHDNQGKRKVLCGK